MTQRPSILYTLAELSWAKDVGPRGTAGPVVCHANRCVLADPDGDESPATAVAGRGTAGPVVCHPTAVGGDFRRTAVAGGARLPAYPRHAVLACGEVDRAGRSCKACRACPRRAPAYASTHGHSLHGARV